MPSRLFAKIGLTRNQVFGAHMFMYGTPFLTILQIPKINLFNEVIENPLLFFEKRVFSDYDFLFGLVFLLILDTIGGGIAALLTYKKDENGDFVLSASGKKCRAFSSVTLYKKMSKKMMGIILALLCIGILKNTLIDGETNVIEKIIDAGFYSIMLGFEGASVLKNAYRIYPWEPIKIILRKLEVFNDKKMA